MPSMHRLQPGQIGIDQPLPWDVFDAAGHLLLGKGFLIQRDDQIESLLERGMYVNAEDFLAPRSPVRFEPLVIWESIIAHLAYLFEAMPQDGSLQEAFARQARQVLLLCDRSPDLALAAIMLMDMRDYPVAHSLHTALVAGMVARRAGWTEGDRLRLCCAALSMNVAMIRLQYQLCNQRESLSPEQRQIINEHPAEGARRLIACGINDDEWLRAVLEHHEIPDGYGYPRHVKTPSEMAMLVHTADVFCAKVSPRAHRRPMIASEATRSVFTKLAHDGKNPFPGLLVKEFGIYPPGTMVKLASGEAGIVHHRGTSAKSPVVAILVNTAGLTLHQPVLRDLSQPDAPSIVAVMSGERMLLGVDFGQIWPSGSAA